MSRPDVSYPVHPDTPVSHLPFSPVVVVGDLVFVSGQASVDETGKIISDSFEGEFRPGRRSSTASARNSATRSRWWR